MVGPHLESGRRLLPCVSGMHELLRAANRGYQNMAVCFCCVRPHWRHGGKGKRRIFNGKLTTAPEGHDLWTWPLDWPGAKHPKLGRGRPSLIFVGDMSDVFHERRPDEIIDRVCATIAVSDHTGLLLSKRSARMAAYFAKQSPATVRRWQRQIWVGFSGKIRSGSIAGGRTCVRSLTPDGLSLFPSRQ